jgi:hypothetical protein
VTRLLTADEFRALPLGLSDRVIEKLDENDSLQFYIDAASEEVEGLCKRYFEARTIDERLEGHDDPKMVLSHYPVVSFTSAYLEHSDGTETAYANSLFDVTSESGIMSYKNRATYSFERGQVYRFVYQTGYTTIPRAVQMATALWTLDLLPPVLGVRRTPDEVESAQSNIIDLLQKFRRDRIR